MTTDGPYRVRGGVPLTTGGIVHDDKGSGRACRRTWTLPPRQQYAPCRC